MNRKISINEIASGRIRDKYSLELITEDGHDLTQTVSITRTDLKEHGYNGRDATPLNNAHGKLFRFTRDLNQSHYTDDQKQSLLEAWIYDHHEVSALIRLINKQLDPSSDDPISLTVTTFKATLTVSANNWTRCVRKADDRIAQKKSTQSYNTKKALLEQIEAKTPKPLLTPLLKVFHQANADDGAFISIVHDITAYPDSNPIRKSEHHKYSSKPYYSNDFREYGFTGSKADIERMMQEQFKQLKRLLSSEDETPSETGRFISYAKGVCALILMLDKHAKETAQNFKSALDGVTLTFSDKERLVTIPQNAWEHYVSRAKYTIALQEKDNTVSKHLSQRNITIAAASGLTLGAIGLGAAVAVEALPVEAAAGVIAMVVLTIVAVTLGNIAHNQAQNVRKKTIQSPSIFESSQNLLTRSESQTSVRSEASDAEFQDAVDHHEKTLEDDLNNWLNPEP